MRKIWLWKIIPWKIFFLAKLSIFDEAQLPPEDTRLEKTMAVPQEGHELIAIVLITLTKKTVLCSRYFSKSAELSFCSDNDQLQHSWHGLLVSYSTWSCWIISEHVYWFSADKFWLVYYRDLRFLVKAKVLKIDTDYFAKKIGEKCKHKWDQTGKSGRRPPTKKRISLPCWDFSL